ncbi:WD40 repeat-like protein [Aspergillus cavernicola]|uniref:WD40 repeat-like protein n=1 Tax=Aspergillus cavernicola TaxID=176166 RepID=A0ABR4I0J3_9EURO
MKSKSEEKPSWRQSVRNRWKRAKKESIPSPGPRVSSAPEEEVKPEPENDTASALPEHFSLWDEAYDLLKKEKPALLSDYESLLSRVAVETEPTLIVPGQDTNNVENTIPQHDVAARRQKLQQIADFSFEKMQEGKLKATFFGKKIVLQEVIGKLGNGMGWVQNYAKDALKDVPYAPAVMACTSLLLPLLTSPSRVDDENNKGILYVTSQIRYYIEMETLLLPDFVDARVKAQLKEQVKSLYKLVIDYQVQSVMKVNRNSGKNYFRSVTDYDGWSDQLNTIKEEEKTLGIRFQGAASWLNVHKLNDLKREAQESRNTLEDIANYTRKIEQHMSDAEYRRCLNTLKATNPQLDKQRIEKFKGGLLKDSYHWVIENQDFKRWMDARSGQLLWIKGQPGKGKTMLLCGIIDELSQIAERDTNIAFFFCQASVETLNNSSAVLRGLISMLVKQQPSLMSYLSEGSFDGHNSWFALQNTLTNILNDPKLQSTYLVIDGLDECIGDRQLLLELLVEHSSAHENIKWIVSSRNWLDIERDLNRAMQIKLHLELNEDVLSKAVHSFIEYKVDKLANRSVESKEKTEIWKAVKDHLLTNANGTFLWVALVCEYLAPLYWWNVQTKLKDVPPDLDKIYERMISQIIHSDNAEICKSILGVTTTVLRPITLDEMMVYINLPGDAVDALEDIVRLCGSFLSVQENTVFLIHQSAKDFLVEKASSEIFPNGKEIAHYNLFSKSLHLLRENLRRDIYNLSAPGYPIEQVKPPHPDPLLAVRYACVYWVDHLSCSKIEDIKKAIQEEGLVDWFLCQSYLHWLEAMSILKSIPGGIASMQKLEKLIQKLTNGEPKSLIHQVRDAIRFVQYTKVAIESSPLQVYYSSLIFSPMQSITRQCYHDRESKRDWIRKEPVVERSWSQCLQTLEGHTYGIFSIAWSRDGSRLASVALDRARIWDLDTSECSLILEEDEIPKSSIWWLDDTQVASMSESAVKVWNLDNSQFVSIFKDHSRKLSSMAWSCDRRRLAFASDKSIRILDPVTTNLESMREGHTGDITSMAWSPDGSHLASGSHDRTIKIWDTTVQSKSINRGHNDIVHSVTWFHDGTQVASESDDKTVRLWDPITASYDEIVRVWDPITSQCTVCEGHTGSITDIAWSHDGVQLASASRDETVRVWNPTTGRQLSICEDHTNHVYTVAWSHDGSQLASASPRRIVISDPTTGHCILNSPVNTFGFLRYDSIDPNYLHTGLGIFDIRVLKRVSISPNDSNHVPKPHGYGLS